MDKLSFENWQEVLTATGLGAALTLLFTNLVKKWTRTKGEKAKDLSEGEISVMNANKEELTVLEMTNEIHKKQIDSAYAEVDRVTNLMHSMKKDFEEQFNKLWEEIQNLRLSLQKEISENNELRFERNLFRSSLQELVDFVKLCCKSVNVKKWEDILNNNK